MKITTEELGCGPETTIEMTFLGLPVYVAFQPTHKHPDDDVTGSAFIMVGYLGERIRWPNGRETVARFTKRLWDPTWEEVVEAVQECADRLVQARDG